MEGEYHTVLDETIKPVIHPPRKVPYSIQRKLKEKLSQLEVCGVVVMLNIFAENLRLLCIFSHILLLVLVSEWHFCRRIQREFEIFFYATEGMKQFVVPVTGCSPWDDFVTLRCQAEQHACYNTTSVDLLDHHAPLKTN